MNYLEHTTIMRLGNTEYKKVRLQKYDERGHKATNKYFIDGKQVHHHDKYICESKLDFHADETNSTFIERKWVK